MKGRLENDREKSFLYIFIFLTIMCHDPSLAFIFWIFLNQMFCHMYSIG
jgi:hypothetical protein